MAEFTRAVNPGTRRSIKDILKQHNIVLLLIISGLVALNVGINGRIALGPQNVRNVLLQSSVRGIGAVGQAFVILGAGIDISIAGIGLVGATIGAALMTSDPNASIIGGIPLPLAAAIPVMLATGVAFGLFNGTLVARLGMPPLVVTLGMLNVTQGTYFQISSQESILGLPESLAFFGANTGYVPNPIIIFLAVAATAYFILTYTSYGRQVYAIGGNPVSAWLSGINEPRIRQSVYMVSGLLGTVAAIVLMSRVMSISYSTMRGVELDTIAACAVGGLSLAGGHGTIIGVVLGVITIGLVNNFLSLQSASTAQFEIAKGLIIIVAVAIDYIRRRDVGATMLRRRGGT